jgi:hypothetical protein
VIHVAGPAWRPGHGKATAAIADPFRHPDHVTFCHVIIRSVKAGRSVTFASAGKAASRRRPAGRRPRPCPPAALPHRCPGRRPSGPESGHRARSRGRSWHVDGEMRPWAAVHRSTVTLQSLFCNVRVSSGEVMVTAQSSTVSTTRAIGQSVHGLTDARPSVRAVALARHRCLCGGAPPAWPDLSRRSVPRFRPASRLPGIHLAAP